MGCCWYPGLDIGWGPVECPCKGVTFASKSFACVGSRAMPGTRTPDEVSLDLVSFATSGEYELPNRPTTEVA
ncbi:hypothetical protein MRX96_021195 [Rhipicephalus microplus]